MCLVSSSLLPKNYIFYSLSHSLEKKLTYERRRRHEYFRFYTQRMTQKRSKSCSSLKKFIIILKPLSFLVSVSLIGIIFRYFFSPFFFVFFNCCLSKEVVIVRWVIGILWTLLELLHVCLLLADWWCQIIRENHLVQAKIFFQFSIFLLNWILFLSLRVQLAITQKKGRNSMDIIPSYL